MTNVWPNRSFAAARCNIGLAKSGGKERLGGHTKVSDGVWTKRRDKLRAPLLLSADGALLLEQRLRQRHLGGSKRFYRVISELRRSQGRINLCRADECVHIVGIERQGTFEIVAGARQKFASNSLIVPD